MSRTLRASMTSLFFHCCPADVSRLIVPVVVRKAIDRVQFRRAWTDVREEDREVVEPFSADADTTRAVSLELRTGWVAAALFHRRPRHIFRRIVQAMSREATTRAVSQLFASQAAATPRYARTETTQARDVKSSAVTTTPPEGRLFTHARLWQALKRHQSSESLVSEIEMWKRHRRTLYRNIVRSWS